MELFEPLSEFLKYESEMMLVLLMSCWWPQMAKLLWLLSEYFWESLFFKQAAPINQCNTLRCKSKDISIC